MINTVIMALPWYGGFEKGSFLQTLRMSPRELGKAPATYDANYHLQSLVLSACSGRRRGRGGGGDGGRRW